MSNYKLDDGEFVLLEEVGIKDIAGSKVDLILTNQNLIEVQYSWLGVPTKIVKYSLLLLREKDGKPNVISDKGQLKLYFKKFDCQYSFSSSRASNKFQDAIIKAFREAFAEREKQRKKEAREERKSSPFYAPVINKLDIAKNAFHSMRVDASSPVERKCPSCGAELTGMKGEEVECPYCQKVVRL